MRLADERAAATAYAACEALAQSHYENFPVASRLLPAHLRPHVAAIYAFARTADDFADEPGYETGERLRLLSDWRVCISRNRQPELPTGSGSRIPTRFLALHDTIDRFRCRCSCSTICWTRSRRT